MTSMSAMATLWRREMVRFFRQRNRVIGALATPIVFYLVLGFGLNDAFQAQPQGSGYLEYFFPGTVVMIVLFTAIFSTISVIEERREGFLQGVLVAPVSRASIVMGKVLGGATIATAQGTLFLLAWPFVSHWPGVPTMILAITVTALLAIGLVALGLSLAWPMDSAAAFHAVMNLVLMPMWVLCGAVFPIATSPTWMQPLMWANPLTYGYCLLTAILRPGQPAMPLAISAPVAIAVTVGAVLLATAVVARPRSDGT